MIVADTDRVTIFRNGVAITTPVKVIRDYTVGNTYPYAPNSLNLASFPLNRALDGEEVILINGRPYKLNRIKSYVAGSGDLVGPLNGFLKSFPAYPSLTGAEYITVLQGHSRKGFARISELTTGAVPPVSTLKRVMFIGDSTSAGVGADPSGLTDMDGARPFSYPLQAASRLAALGIPVTTDTVCSEQANGATTITWTAYRPDVAVQGVMSAGAAGAETIGGLQTRASAGAIGYTFTTTAAVDTFDFWYSRSAGFGTLGYSIDGGAIVPVVETNATDAFVKFSVTGLPLAVHSIAFTRVAGSAYMPMLIDAYNSAIPSLHVLNGGARGWTTAKWIQAGFPNSPLNALAVLAANVAVINLGINDYRTSGTSIATFKANMQTIINTVVAAGALVILVVPTPIGSYSVVTDAWSQAAVLQAYQELAATNNVPLVNTPAVLFAAGLGAVNPATWASLSAVGATYDAALHPKGVVYAAEGAAVGDAIKTALGL